MERSVGIQCYFLGYAVRKGCKYTGCSYWLNPKSCWWLQKWPQISPFPLSWPLGDVTLQLLLPMSVSLSPPVKWELVLRLALINSMWQELWCVCPRLGFKRLCMRLLALLEACFRQVGKPRGACWEARSHWKESHGVLAYSKPNPSWL